MTDEGEYIAAHSSPEHPYLRELRRATYIHLVRPHMVSGHVEGVTLKMLTEMICPHNVLEIGTFSGYSAIAISLGLPKGGRIYTFDINDEIAGFAGKWISGSPRAESIVPVTGDVLKLLPAFAKEHGGLRFDMVFIDGNKREYLAYYDMARRFLRKGGYILADNTLWDGHVTDPAYDRDAQTLGIREFNDRIKDDAEAEKVILPLRDGLTMIRIS